jgi:hypothetical protein
VITIGAAYLDVQFGAYQCLGFRFGGHDSAVVDIHGSAAQPILNDNDNDNDNDNGNGMCARSAQMELRGSNRGSGPIRRTVVGDRRARSSKERLVSPIRACHLLTAQRRHSDLLQMSGCGTLHIVPGDATSESSYAGV